MRTSQYTYYLLPVCAPVFHSHHIHTKTTFYQSIAFKDSKRKFIYNRHFVYEKENPAYTYAYKLERKNVEDAKPNIVVLYTFVLNYRVYHSIG